MNARGRDAARAIADRVAEITPRGMPWESVADRVALHRRALEDALRDYSATDTPEARAKLASETERWVQAWRRAVEAWKRDGCPTADDLEREYTRAERLGMMTDAPVDGTDTQEGAA